uniref:Uncharacterized protein n=1 Tax=Avena sativa TaxID=4498 RepID=A0ACD5THE4_AVESA
MARIVHVHHVDKDAFLRGNIDPDPDELDLVFEHTPTYAEVLEQLRIELKWMDPKDDIELEGRHNVGLGMHVRWKTMRIFSEARWLAYKEVVAESLDKALELFATKKVGSSLSLNLNRMASPLRTMSPPPVDQELSREPPFTQTLSTGSRHQDEVMEEDNDDCGGEDEDDNDDVELPDNNVGDLEKYITQDDMDHDLPYSRGYASDSNDDGPEEEVDEEGFTAREAEIHDTVLGRDHRVPLFRDLSLADESTVDGGKGIVLGPRTSSYRDGNEVNSGFCKGSRFRTLLEFKQWIKDFSVKHRRPYTVVHSDIKKRYTVKCEEEGCPWIVRARPFKGGPDWHISSCVSTHMCRGPVVDGKDAKNEHRQLTSEFLAYRLSNAIASFPIMTIKMVMELVKALFHYEVKYGKAWKAKQAAFKMLYGMATQPNKANDGEGVNYSKIWANAMEVVEKRKEAEEERKRKEAEEERKMKEAEEEKRRKAFEEVVQLARDLAKKKDEEDEVNKKKEEEEMNRKKKKEEEERKRQKEKEEEERNRRANARPPCVDQEERPCKAFRTDEAHGKEVPICWCGTDCTVKESLDYHSIVGERSSSFVPTTIALPCVAATHTTLHRLPLRYAGTTLG